MDEQILPFKRISSLKQYIPSKPRRWSYKVFSLCGVDDIIYEFEVSARNIQPLPGEPDLGAGSNMVLQLAKSIREGINHLLYFEKSFTSLPLITYLANKKIHSLRTVRINRLQGIFSGSDKYILKKGRGALQGMHILFRGLLTQRGLNNLMSDSYALNVKKKFNRSDHITTHFKNHAGKKPYECSQLERRFAQ